MSQWKDNRRGYLIESTVLAPFDCSDYEVQGVEVSSRNPGLLHRIAMIPVLPFGIVLPELCKPVIVKVFHNMLREFASGVQLVHNVRIGREYLSWASYYLAKELGVPFLITPNYSPRMMKPLGRIVTRSFQRLLQLADGVFVFTREEGLMLSELGVDPSRICQIAVGPLVSKHHDSEGFRAKFGIKGKMVLFLGQKLPYKGYAQLLAATSTVWRRHPETFFVFIGPHYRSSRKVFEQCKDPRILDFDGVGPFDELKASAMAACDCFVLPSVQEGFGGSYVEAWHYGKPVVGCNIPFVREVIQDGVDGILVPQEPVAIAEAIIRLLSRPDIATRMGKAGQEKVQSTFTWDRIVDKVESEMLQRVYSSIEQL